MKEFNMPVACTMNICNAGDKDRNTVEECAVRMAKAGKKKERKKETNQNTKKKKKKQKQKNPQTNKQTKQNKTETIRTTKRCITFIMIAYNKQRLTRT